MATYTEEWGWTLPEYFWQVSCSCREDSYVMLGPEGRTYVCVRCERDMKLTRLS